MTEVQLQGTEREREGIGRERVRKKIQKRWTGVFVDRGGT